MKPTYVNLVVVIAGFVFLIAILIHYKITEYKQTNFRNNGKN